MSIPHKKSNFWLKFSARGGSSARGGRGALGGKKQPILALAPMAGITDSAFRQMCKKYGADVVYTEMVSADGLYHDSKKTLEFLKFAKAEKPVVIQLFGKHPEKFTKAAQICEQAGFDGIDINFGCPAKKVAGHGGGVTLMRDLAKCRRIIEEVMKGTSLPVSVKLRSSIMSFRPKIAEGDRSGGIPLIMQGIPPLVRSSGLGRDDKEEKIDLYDKKITALDFLKAMADLPLACVMIHGRPYERPFDAEIDYEMIKSCVQYGRDNMPQTIVLGNGGIKAPEDAKLMIDKTGVDGVGLARGLYGKPWLFKQTKDYLKNGRYKEWSQKQVVNTILDHARMALKAKGDYGLIELRKHLLWYVSGWSNAKELRSKLVKVEKLPDLKKIFKA